MIKQWVAEIRGALYRFRVFESGDPKWLVFTALDPLGCDWGLHVPVRKDRLTRAAKRALRGGMA